MSGRGFAGFRVQVPGIFLGLGRVRCRGVQLPNAVRPFTDMGGPVTDSLDY